MLGGLPASNEKGSITIRLDDNQPGDNKANNGDLPLETGIREGVILDEPNQSVAAMKSQIKPAGGGIVFIVNHKE